MRLLALLAFLVAGCTPAPTDAPAPGTRPGPIEAEDTAAERAQAAGLSPAQADSLVALGYPVLVPTTPTPFRLGSVTIEDDEDGAVYVQLRYRRPDGQCLAVVAGNDGFGGPELPAERLPVLVASIGRAAVLHRASVVPTSEEAQTYGAGGITSEYFDLDGLVHTFHSNDEGCNGPVSLEDAAAFVAGLRPLDPADDAALQGEYAFVEGVMSGDAPTLPGGADPEAAARQAFGGDAEEGSESDVETLRRTERRAVVLVTTLGLADDSVADDRLRIVYVRAPGHAEWQVWEVGRQQRCRAGRGHPAWGPEPCR